jgi:hypothetical protein
MLRNRQDLRQAERQQDIDRGPQAEAQARPVRRIMVKIVIGHVALRLAAARETRSVRSMLTVTT